MRFGVFLLAARFPGQDDGAALTRSLDVVDRAEAVGFDDAWIAEHHFMSYGVCPSAVTFAAHALGRTRRISVGTAVSVLSTAHPVALAEQAAMLDRVSGGRFRLGVGRGGPWVDLEVFGTGAARFETGFAPALDVLLDALSGSVAASGEFFAFREVPVVPRPVSLPPVTVACTSPATVRLAARRGLPMLLGMHIGDVEKAEMVDCYAKAAAEAGRDPAAPHVSAVLAQVGEDRADARSRLRAAMPGWLRDGLAGYVPVDDRPYRPRDADAYTDLLCRLHPVGGPRECADRLAAAAERTGIDHTILFVEGTGDPDAVSDNVTALGDEVLPLLR